MNKLLTIVALMAAGCAQVEESQTAPAVQEIPGEMPDLVAEDCSLQASDCQQKACGKTFVFRYEPREIYIVRSNGAHKKVADGVYQAGSCYYAVEDYSIDWSDAPSDPIFDPPGIED